MHAPRVAFSLQPRCNDSRKWRAEAGRDGELVRGVDRPEARSWTGVAVWD